MVKYHSYAENPPRWLEEFAKLRGEEDRALVEQFIKFYDQPEIKEHLAKGLAIADILLMLGLDTETVAAALIYPALKAQSIHFDAITELLGEAGNKLLHDVLQMQSLGVLQHLDSRGLQVEKLRKMLLAMVTDVRAVLIILAERLWQLRQAKNLNVKEQQRLAQETHDVYAPLANRLGIWQLKWEIEDMCLRYLQPEVYTKIAKWLATRREERELYIKRMIDVVSDLLKDAGIHDFQVTGRVKHIDSIHRKIERKGVTIEEIYDISALRVLVPEIKDCYNVLSILQAMWQQVPKEFDDYISQPKPNGYRSIHTVLIGPENRYIEVQIRTYQMHQESELGVAAHWRYKEKVSQSADYENKIALLRQIMAWQKEVIVSGGEANKKEIANADLFADRIYVFTPTGEIIDLPKGSTPLDFAYHIHSEVGHRCRGAKVDGKMVSLKYTLQTGERVEIQTAKQANPSRDWLNPHLGYLKSPRARARAQHWFRMQDNAQNITYGRDLMEKELKRLGAIEKFDLATISQKLHYKSSDDMLAALGSGDLRIAQIMSHIRPAGVATTNIALHSAAPTTRHLGTPKEKSFEGIKISGVSNLLTQIAKCCKPLPGDQVIGYITRNRAVTIHRRDCGNILNPNKVDRLRLIEVNWGGKQTETYPVHLQIRTYDRSGLLRDITALLANEKINVLGLTTKRANEKDTEANIFITIEITDVQQLKKAIDLIRKVPNVIEVHRQ